MNIPDELFLEILEIYDIGSRNFWHNRCFSTAIRERVIKFKDDPVKLERSIRSLNAKRRPAASQNKTLFKIRKWLSERKIRLPILSKGV